MIVEALVILLFFFGLAVALTGTTLARTDADTNGQSWMWICVSLAGLAMMFSTLGLLQ